MSETVAAPAFIYGTAWKQDRTRALVVEAVRAGFRALDTANQPRHYDEAQVGEAVAELAGEGVVARDALFVQTKFTPLHGHDRRVPYDPEAEPGAQVRESFQSSLRHLRTDRVDAYLLHGPQTAHGLVDADWSAWRAIETIHGTGRARLIGVSNFSAAQLAELVRKARVPPMIVQNRCFASRGWDREVRALCRDHGIMYQAFSLLTANPDVVAHPQVRSLAARLGVGPAAIVFRFAVEAGMVPLTGTTRREHMREALDVLGLELPAGAVDAIEAIAG